MLVTVLAQLSPPGDKIDDEAPSFVVFTRRFEIKLTEIFLHQIVSHHAIVPYCGGRKFVGTIVSYDMRTNILIARGMMDSVDIGYIEEIINEGWIPDLVVAQEHGIPMPDGVTIPALHRR